MGREGCPADHAWEFLNDLAVTGFQESRVLSIRKHMGLVRPIMEEMGGMELYRKLFLSLAHSCSRQVETAVFILGPAILSPKDPPTPENILEAWNRLGALVADDAVLASNETFVMDLLRIRAGVVKDPKWRRVLFAAPALTSIVA